MRSLLYDSVHVCVCVFYDHSFVSMSQVYDLVCKENSRTLKLTSRWGQNRASSTQIVQSAAGIGKLMKVYGNNLEGAQNMQLFTIRTGGGSASCGFIL